VRHLHHSTVAFPCLWLLLACSGDAPFPGASESSPGPEWRALFNGEDLSGWTVKITGSEPGDDPNGTFRVEDGLLTVGYEDYDAFDDRFGHIFFETAFSDYELSVEYRFVGEQLAGGPDWAFKNSGIMVHSQSPESMLPEQDFPISIEVQLLGGNGTDPRPTANLCTPGTDVTMNGELLETHCVNSRSTTFHGEEWVTVNVVVYGDSIIHHMVNGDTVMSYSRPAVGGGVVDGYDPAVKIDGTPLTSGFIALQSESHPVQFRSVLLRELGSRE
jgi:3-keto-disaccharide hydrolase